MTFQEIKDGMVEIIQKPNIEIPDCFTANGFMYCFCGHCEPENFELPEDLKRIIAFQIIEKVKNDNN